MKYLILALMTFSPAAHAGKLYIEGQLADNLGDALLKTPLASVGASPSEHNYYFWFEIVSCNKVVRPATKETIAAVCVFQEGKNMPRKILSYAGGNKKDLVSPIYAAFGAIKGVKVDQVLIDKKKGIYRKTINVTDLELDSPMGGETYADFNN